MTISKDYIRIILFFVIAYITILVVMYIKLQSNVNRHLDQIYTDSAYFQTLAIKTLEQKHANQIQFFIDSEVNREIDLHYSGKRTITQKELEAFITDKFILLSKYSDIDQVGVTLDGFKPVVVKSDDCTAHIGTCSLVYSVPINYRAKKVGVITYQIHYDHLSELFKTSFNRDSIIVLPTTDKEHTQMISGKYYTSKADYQMIGAMLGLSNHDLTSFLNNLFGSRKIDFINKYESYYVFLVLDVHGTTKGAKQIIYYKDDKVSNFYQFYYILIVISFFGLAVITTVYVVEKEYKDRLTSQLTYKNEVQNNISSGIALLTPDGDFLEVNRYLADMLGYQVFEFKYRSCLDVTMFEDYEITRASLVRASKGETVKFIKNCVAKDKTIVYVEVTLSRLSDGNILSIIDNLEHEHKLKELGDFARLLIEINPVPIYIKDKDYRYTDCNAAFLKLVESTKDEVIGRTTSDVVPSTLAIELHKKGFDPSKGVQIYSAKVMGKSGIKMVEFHKTALFKEGQFDGILGVVLDVSERVNFESLLKLRLEEEMQKNAEQQALHQEEIVKSAKFSALGQLSAGIIHEINTPLAYIKANVELLEMDVASIEDGAIKSSIDEEVAEIHGGIERLANIVNSMKQIAGKSSEEIAQTNVYETMLTSLTMLYNKSKHISKIYINNQLFDLSAKIEMTPFMAFVQAQRIEQVWIIVINNALDELVKMGEYEERRLNIELSQNESLVKVKIHDNAGGIENDMLGKIFEPFVSTKTHGGMGIGLNVAKKIVEDQNGAIHAYNDSGGAVFEITLPKYNASDKHLKLTHLKVLLVESDEITRESYALSFEGFFKEFRVAVDGRAGLEVFGEFFPDVVISAVTMPKMNGIAMANYLKEIYDFKMILIVGQEEEDLIYHITKGIVDGYLFKPLVSDEILEKIIEII